MLKNWSIQNFKPILDSGDLQLAPVTVLAGRNSSGKSSLIQSILMIAQTLSNRVLDRPLLPNGPIVQLGTFEDILSEQTDLRTLVVGFELEIGKEHLKTQTGIITKRTGGRFAPDIKSVRVTTQFRSASSNGTSTSAIEASKVNVESVSLEIAVFLRQLSAPSPLLFKDEELDISLDFHLDIHQLPSEKLDIFLKDVQPEFLRHVPYPLQEANYLATFQPTDKKNRVFPPTPSLVSFSHFLPSRLFGKYIIEERRKQRFIRWLNRALTYPIDYLESTEPLFDDIPFLTEPIPKHTKGTLINLCNEKGIHNAFSGETFFNLVHWYKSLKPKKNERIAREELIKIISEGISEGSTHTESTKNNGTEAMEALTNNIYVENLEKAVEQIIQFFASKMRYLGPLRADPQMAQKFAPSSELDDVGQKGEYAAAVYDANQNASIQWYNPVQKNIDHNTLKFALDTWVRYLGVADEIKIQMAGQSGVSWQVVHMKGHKALPLTAVGVGVSQILPILVMGLLAPEDTLLLVEQPELHLHPGVQARLGDFFMGLAQCNKQCLIETHSENLINQLRYHIVQAEDQEKNNCLIYFVDQDEQGATQFIPIEISSQGNILNWPDGFFDETMLQEDRITAASLKKRARQ